VPDVRYVCLSDTHFGADNSLLTNLQPGTPDADPLRSSPVLQAFVACLSDVISKNENADPPTLILNGDILELALTTDNNAAMAFERFMELVVPKGGKPLFANEVIYLPGNHDHHLWETARETQYANFINRNPTRIP
jgi:metallophosphoesterase superfamily enzyme